MLYCHCFYLRSFLSERKLICKMVQLNEGGSATELCGAGQGEKKGEGDGEERGEGEGKAETKYVEERGGIGVVG